VKLKGIRIFLCFVFCLGVLSPVWAQQSACESGDLSACQCVEGSEDNLKKARGLVADSRWVEAADLLEGVLMRCPAADSVFSYYSWLLVQLTDSQQSQTSLYGQVAEDFDWQLSQRLGVQSGYSDNLSRAPTQSTVVLNVANNPLTLDLMPDFKVHSGFSSLLNGGVNAYKRLSPAVDWRLQGDFASRLSGEEGYADYQRLHLLSAFNYQTDALLAHGVTVGFDVLRYQNDQYFAVVEAQFEQRWRVNEACHLISGEDFVWQRQLDLSVMDGYYAALRGGVSCLFKGALYQLEGATGGDWGERLRPGGTRWRNQVRASAIWPLDAVVPGSVLRTIGQFSQVNDARQYSVLLGAGKKRQVQQFLLKTSYQWPIIGEQGGLLSGQVDLSWQEESSNMALFGVDFIELWGGVNFKW
jgi:hypothetical protein